MTKEYDRLIKVYQSSDNLNTEDNWDAFHDFHKGILNYPPKFKYISQELLNLENKNAKVLEIACGYGFLLKQIKTDHPDFQVEGMDFSKIVIDFINSKGLLAKKGIIPNDLKNYSNYDAVIGTEILEHLSESDRIKTLKEVYRILNKGGKAIFTVPNNVLTPKEERFHLTCFNQKTFKELLSQVFNLCGVVQRRFLVSDNPHPAGLNWGECPFLIGVCYKGYEN